MNLQTSANDIANPTSTAGGAVKFGSVTIGGGISNTTLMVWAAVAVVVFFIWKGKK